MFRPLLIASAAAAIALLAAPACDSGDDDPQIDATTATDTASTTTTDTATTSTTQPDTSQPDTTPPTITSTTPAAGSSSSRTLQEIRFTTSEQLNPSSVIGAYTVKLTSLADGQTRTLIVKHRFESGAWVIYPDESDGFFGGRGTYEVTLAATLSDTSGNTLGAPYTWTFQTTL